MREIIRARGYLSLMLVMLIAAVLLSGCGAEKKDNTEEPAAGYIAKDIDLGVEVDEDIVTGEVRVFNGYVYYQRIDFPKYPQEYYDALEKISSNMTNSQGKNDTSDEIEEESREEENKKEEKTAEKKTEEISDDELLGNVDDIFGDIKTEKKEDKKEDKSVKDDEIKTYEELDEKYKDYKTICGMYRLDMDTGRTTHLFDFDEESYTIKEYYVDSNENMVCFLDKSDYDKKTMSVSHKYYIEEYNASGIRLSSVMINDKLNVENFDEFTYMGENYVRIGDSEHIYLQCDDKTINVINSRGEEKGSFRFEKKIIEYSYDSDKNIVAYCADDAKGDYVRIDINSGKVTGKIEGICKVEEDYYSYSLARDFKASSLMTRDDLYLYDFDYVTGTRKQILKWIDVGIIGENINYIIPIDDERIYYNCNNSNNGKEFAGIISKSDETDSGKKVIRLMMLEADTEVQEKIINYNKSNKNYRIELISYDNDRDAMTSFNNQLITGDYPDIIDIADMDIKSYVRKDILEDLTPYIENDAVVNRDYFIDGYLDSVSTDDRVYYLSRNFYIDSIVGKASELGKYKDGWTVRDIMEYYNSKPEGTILFFYDYKTEAFRNLILADIESYIDWETGEVDFSGKQFREVMEFCNRFPPNSDDSPYDTARAGEYVREGKLLLKNDSIYGTAEFQAVRKLYDNDYMFVGYPCREGRGIYLQFDHAFAISSGADDKDGAWDVLKTLISNPDKSKIMVMMSRGIPASKDEFEEVMERDTATEKYIDRYGNEILPRDAHYGYDDYQLRITPATKAEVKRFKELIGMATKINRCDIQLNDIMLDNVEPYFEGKKSIDEVINILQDKVSKYVNENM